MGWGGGWGGGGWGGGWGGGGWGGYGGGWGGGGWGGYGLSAIPWSWGYWPYYNPYYTGPVVDGSTTFDYSQPIVVAQAAASQPSPKRV